jgi:hypothetical protein
MILSKMKLQIGVGLALGLGVSVLSGLYLKARLDETRIRMQLVTAQLEATTEAAKRMAAQTDLLIQQIEESTERRGARDRAITRETDQCLDAQLPSGLLD